MTIEQSIDILCDQINEAGSAYGYTVFQRFGELHIRTRYESWYLEARDVCYYQLWHGNQPGNVPEGWHRQRICIAQDGRDIVTYIHEHEEYKYQTFRWSYHFPKTSRRQIRREWKGAHRYEVESV